VREYDGQFAHVFEAIRQLVTPPKAGGKKKSTSRDGIVIGISHPWPRQRGPFDVALPANLRSLRCRNDGGRLVVIVAAPIVVPPAVTSSPK